jgi:antitoxin HicB
MLSYPAKIARDGDGFVVSFPDVPEAITGASTHADALREAVSALTTAMEFYFEDRRLVPLPSALKRGQVEIDLPASISAKVLLLNEMVAQGKKPAELARQMSVRPQEVTRLLDLHHPTKIDTVSAALKALGRKLDLQLV